MAKADWMRGIAGAMESGLNTAVAFQKMSEDERRQRVTELTNWYNAETQNYMAETGRMQTKINQDFITWQKNIGNNRLKLTWLQGVQDYQMKQMQYNQSSLQYAGEMRESAMNREQALRLHKESLRNRIELQGKTAATAHALETTKSHLRLIEQAAKEPHQLELQQQRYAIPGARGSQEEPYLPGRVKPSLGANPQFDPETGKKLPWEEAQKLKKAAAAAAARTPAQEAAAQIEALPGPSGATGAQGTSASIVNMLAEEEIDLFRGATSFEDLLSKLPIDPDTGQRVNKLLTSGPNPISIDITESLFNLLREGVPGEPEVPLSQIGDEAFQAARKIMPDLPDSVGLPPLSHFMAGLSDTTTTPVIEPVNRSRSGGLPKTYRRTRQ